MKEKIKKGRRIEKMKGKRGITLIALIITIIVMLILVAVTINVAISSGLFKTAKRAVKRTQEERDQELELAEGMLNINNKLYASAEDYVAGNEYVPPLCNAPKLMDGMTAKRWDSTTNDWVTVENPTSDTTWYNYGSQQWANAQTEDGSMWVWIPRFAYKINAKNYHKNTAGTIDITFLKNKETTAEGITIVDYDATTTENFTRFPNGYVVHPAFKFGEEELEGIWVAKFEASNSNGNIKVVPDVPSWRSITVNEIFTKCKEYNQDLNSHMMKNSEWGAVAYLAQSQYGVNREVYINNSSDYYTGRSGGNVGGSTQIKDTYTDQTSENDVLTYGFYTWDGYLLDYDTNTKSSTRDETKVASTTGNVTGIYDMSGGAYEYVAAYVANGDDNLLSYGKSLVDETDLKYKDVYSKAGTDNGSNNYSANSAKYGDAVYETSAAGTGSTSWPSDYSYFPYASDPFFKRGGHWGNQLGAGLFSFYGHRGGGGGSYSFRPVLASL